MVEIMKKLLRKEQYTEIVAEGKDLMSRLLYLIWFGDFIPYYLALENKVNPGRVYTTKFLRKELTPTRKLI